MSAALAVFLGGGLGSLARFLDRALDRRAGVERVPLAHVRSSTCVGSLALGCWPATRRSVR
jgi:fluoride ion exporter CrcB/FEX